MHATKRPADVSGSPPSVLRSAKRTSLERKGPLHAWHPYYAGYSEEFVASAIAHLGCNSTSLILDPWGGSGTTAIVAARGGLNCISVDVNPAMSTFAAAKSVGVLSYKEVLQSFFGGLSKLLDAKHNASSDDPLNLLFGPGTVADIRLIVGNLPFPKESPISARAPVLGHGSQPLHPGYAFCMAALFVTLRELSGVKKASNPTWMKAGQDRVDVSSEQLVAKLQAKVETMLGNVREYYSSSISPKGVTSLIGDVKALSLEAGTIDSVITSPPYLTRIDYAVSTAPELALFEDISLLHQVRHATMGSPVITKQAKAQQPHWGPLCNGILDAIAAHDTKAASSYYWKNIVSYFMDLDAALDEISRVLRTGGNGLLVVQSSYFKEIELPLGEIYVEMAREKGLVAEIAFREQVKNHMAHVNTKSSRYKSGKVYHEDAVFVQKL